MLERLTEAEERLRDRTLGRLLARIVPEWVQPNHVTSLRMLLVGIAFVLFLSGYSLQMQTDVLVLAALTDSVDGILARTRGQSSQLGEYLDQLSDWLLGGWMGILTLTNGLLPTGVVLMIVIPQVVTGVTDRIKASTLKFETPARRIVAVAMGPANFRPNLLARLQFVAVLMGFISLLRAKASSSGLLRKIGLASLYVEASISWLLAAQGIASMLRHDRPNDCQSTG
ncbi:MAG: CDP-alcohol phosphatidyltransferase family protein [Bacillota bacterium]